MEILVTESSEGYELIDSGEGEKLERYGEMTLSRPDPQAIWPKKLGSEKWDRADAVYSRSAESGKWKVTGGKSETWQVKLEGITFNLKLLPSKHLGLFPEQSAQWKWLEKKISTAGRKVSVLNLFAYTGGASIACAKAGAEVCHLDASKFPVDFAHKNLEDSGLGDKKVRFMVDDARKFVEREIKRGNKYDVILMDPPVYGKGANGEVWKIEEDLIPLLRRVKSLFSSNPLAIVLNGYASVYSATTYSQILGSITDDLGGEITFGELAIRETSGGRLLPAGIFARWEK